MNRSKKYLPTSFRRTVISKNKSSRRDLHFVACSKAIKVFNRFTGDCLGNVYFNGEEFYFSGQLNKSIRHLDYKKYFQVQDIITDFLYECKLVSGLRK